MSSRFTIVRPLGSGGQGRVVAVRDAARDDAVVALKETSERDFTSLRREFGLLARLRHPHLVAVYDWFDRSPLAGADDQGAPAAYTQELVDGADLWRALRDADLSERDVVFEQVLRALAYLHALGVAHLDLKPDNVLVERSAGAPLARMLDFGIARPIGEVTESARGSFSYVAPEILAGRPFDQRADLYALGVMMAEVCIGRPPPPELLRGSLAVAAARRLWLLEQGVAPTWLALVTALCDRDPAARPRSAHEAAILWARERGTAVVLHTPAAVAAMVRAGAPVGRVLELARCRAAIEQAGAAVLTGPAGSGRRTVARAAAREAQSLGHAVEWWPHGAAAVRSFGEALARLLDDEEVANLVSRTASGRPHRDEGSLGREDEAGRFAAWVDETGGRLAQELVKRSSPRPQPVLVVDGLERLPRLVRAVLLALVRAAEAGEALPLALILTGESHDGPAAAALGPLGRQAVSAFVAVRFGAAAADPRLCAALAAASGGHPLHLETLVALLVARGELSLDGSEWRWRGDAERLELPDGMEEALEQRLGLLDQAERAALGAVAWLRFPAPADAVAAALALDGPPRAALLGLEAAGLLWRDPQGLFRSAHPSLATRLSDWTPPGTLAAAHERVIARAELEPLARAWHCGGEVGAGLALAEGRARWAEGNAELAAEALDLALALAPEAPEALALRAEVANLLGPRELQVACLEKLVARLPAGNPRALKVKSGLFWTLTRIGDAARAERVGRELVELARAQGEQELLAEALVHLAIAHTQRGEFDESERLLREAEAEAAPGALGLRARIANNLGNVYAYRADHETALVRYGEAFRLKTLEGDPVGQRIAVGNMGLTCLHLGRLAEAQRHFAASYEAARHTGHRRGEAWSLVGLSMLGLEAGAWRYARRRAERALMVAEELGDQLVACDAETTLAECLVALGEREAGAERARSGLARAEGTQNGYTAARARLLLAAGRLQVEPVEAVEAAQAIEQDELADAITRARAASLVARGEIRRGDLDAAAAAARRAVERDGARRAPEVLATAAEILRLLGDGRELARLLGEVVGQLEALELRWPAAPEGDGVDAEAVIDGPSRASFAARPEVRALRAAADIHRFTAGGAIVSEQSLRAEGLSARWVGPALAGGVAELETALGAWLVGAVQELEAERGFVAAGDGRVIAARDVDGEEISDAARKLPAAAVAGARERGGPWLARGASGRGAILGLPLAVGCGAAKVDAALVLQNRFVPDAFATLVAEPPDLTAPATLLRVWGLERAVAAAEERARTAEERHRDQVTRSTEEVLSLRRELESTREQLGPAHAYREIIFASAGMRRMLRQVDRVVDTDLPVYIHGESGTGKELVARAIHYNGSRARGPFVTQNVSAIPSTLFESELFGHERGAFTGAHRASEGLFRRASGGTLFLDEIGDLPLDLQSKLLRVLETGEVRPIGGSRSLKVDVRVITATHHDLAELLRQSRFREDLFYRLNVIRIDVPPLRERPDDIPVLVGHFLELRRDAAGLVRLGDGVMKALIGFGWPGNVRQLENEVTRAALLADGGIIQKSDLSPEIANSRRGAGARGASVGSSADGTLARLGLDRGTLKERVDRLEELILRDAMQAAGKNKSQVARGLGLSRAGLNMKLKRLGLWEG